MNPSNAPKVTGKQVLEYAKHLGVDIKKDVVWWTWDKERELWVTSGATNYLAMEYLKQKYS